MKLRNRYHLLDDKIRLNFDFRSSRNRSRDNSFVLRRANPILYYGRYLVIE